MATLIKKLTMQLGDQQIECQLDQAELVDEPSTEEVETFCGTDIFATPNYKLNLGGFQDWVIVDSLCEIIHAAYTADPIQEIAFGISLGEDNLTASPPTTAKHRSGRCKPSQDINFGGQAGSPLKFTVTLPVVGIPAETPLAPPAP